MDVAVSMQVCIIFTSTDVGYHLPKCGKNAVSMLKGKYVSMLLPQNGEKKDYIVVMWRRSITL